MIDKTRPGQRYIGKLTERVGLKTGDPYLYGWAGPDHHYYGQRGRPDEQGRPVWHVFLVENPKQRRLDFRRPGEGPPGAPRKPQNCGAIDR